eukprot:c37406_g1_i1 orf=81-1712(+)
MDPQSGFCKDTGIYHSKRVVPPLPSDLELSLPAFLQQQSCSNISSIAYVDFEGGTSVSYAQLHAHIKVAAAGLALRLGVRKGDVLLLVAPNSTQFVVLLQAALSIGAIVTTCNPLSLPLEIAKQASDCATKFVATTAALAHKIADLHLPLILLGEAQHATLPPHVSFSKLLSASAGNLPRIPIFQDDTAVLLYSSGTTGTSKGVMLSHRNLIAQAWFFMNRPDADGTTSTTSRVYLCIIPMFHAYGLAIFSSAALGKGCPIILLPKFDMLQMLSAIQEYKVTHLPSVPPVLLALAKSSLVGDYDLSSLREISVGAAPVSRELITAFKARFANVTVLQGYGLTESTAVGANTLTAEESQQFGSTGLLAPNIEAKIVNVDSGKPMPPNYPGEIWLRGPVIMKGYFARPEITATSVDQEGWLHTGDLGYIDSNGYLFIVDRIKELIKYNGYQVAPAELEAVLLSHPHIQDAAVVPYTDEKAGQIPMAYVVLAGEPILSEAEVINFVAQKVAPFKKVRRVAVVSSIPKSPSGKILRRQLVAKAASKL